MRNVNDKMQSGASLILGGAIGLMLDSGMTEEHLRELIDVAIDIAMATRLEEPTDEQAETFTNSIMNMMGPDLEWRMREITRKLENGTEQE